jgi:hypothetical protein
MVCAAGTKRTAELVAITTVASGQNNKFKPKENLFSATNLAAG